MSDSVRPHRQQPTRLPHPSDSPGKNTGVGCHFLLQCMKMKSESEVTQSCLALSDPMDCSLPGSSVHGIFQARVLEWGAIAFSKYYARAAVIKYLQLGGLKNRNILSHGSGAESPKSNFLLGLFLPRAVRKGSAPGPSPWSWWLSFSLCLFTLPLSMHISVPKFPLLIRTPVLLDKGPP